VKVGMMTLKTRFEVKTRDSRLEGHSAVAHSDAVLHPAVGGHFCSNSSMNRPAEEIHPVRIHSEAYFSSRDPQAMAHSQESSPIS